MARLSGGDLGDRSSSRRGSIKSRSRWAGWGRGESPALRRIARSWLPRLASASARGWLCSRCSIWQIKFPKLRVDRSLMRGKRPCGPARLEGGRNNAQLLAGCLLLLFIGGLPGRAQNLSSPLESRLRNLSSIAKDSVKNECGELLTRIDAETLTPRSRAKALDRLRDACSRRLTWTDPLLARLAERAVAQRRAFDPEDPAALCQALRTLGLIYHYQGQSDKALGLYQEAVAFSRRWQGKDRGTTDEDVAAALESLSSLLSDL